MRKMIILAAALALAAGCSNEPKHGIGVVPLQGATLTGKVVEASQPSGVLMKTQSDRSFLLPDNWKYQQNGKPVAVSDLSPGATVTAIAPPSEARLVSASNNNLVLESDREFFSFPAEGLAPAARQAPVQVQTTGGEYQEMPLMQAMQAYPQSVMSHPYYEDYTFQTASPSMMGKGVPVGMYGNSPLMLAPTSTGLGLVQLPQAYPVQSFSNHQPVRFTYQDNNVAVSSWNSLGDGQFNLSNLLLAGKLLDILPGQAVIQVGQSPVTVPWNYVTYQGMPVGDRRYPVGTPLGINYYPGAYDFVSYDHNNVTFLYDQYPVQIPVSYLPDYAYQRPVRVRGDRGHWVNMPFQAARRLVDNGNYWIAPSPIAMPYIQNWSNGPAWDPRPVRGMPGYQLVGHNGYGPGRVVPIDRHRGNDWWAYRPDWGYTLSGLAGPVAWNLTHKYRDNYYRNDHRWPIAHQPHRGDNGRHLGWYKQPKGKHKQHFGKHDDRWDRQWWVDDRRRDDRRDDRRDKRRNQDFRLVGWNDHRGGNDWRDYNRPRGRKHDDRKDHRIAYGGPKRGEKPRKNWQPPREERQHRIANNHGPKRGGEKQRQSWQQPRQERQHRIANNRPRQNERQRQVRQQPRQERQHRVANNQPRQNERQRQVRQQPRQERQHRVANNQPRQNEGQRQVRQQPRQERQHRVANNQPRQERQVRQQPRQERQQRQVRQQPRQERQQRQVRQQPRQERQQRQVRQQPRQERQQRQVRQQPRQERQQRQVRQQPRQERQQRQVRQQPRQERQQRVSNRNRSQVAQSDSGRGQRQPDGGRHSERGRR